ncbi:hypothetical protein Tco_0940807 [Tanacetum coccineum]|uniref:Uncharacterized protein n=1 Tax=Tanacetum coccineum TaxID=301880 RepID=A0ABQ5DPR5_9ASTR
MICCAMTDRSDIFTEDRFLDDFKGKMIIGGDDYISTFRGSFGFMMKLPFECFDEDNVDVSSEPTVSAHHAKKVDFVFVISFDESDDDDYTFTYDENSFSYKLISFNDLKPDSGTDNDKINVELSSEDIPIELLRTAVIDANIDTHSHEFDEDFEMSHDIPDFEERLGRIFSKQMHRLHVLDFDALTEDMDQAITARLKMDHIRGDRQVVFSSHAWRRLFEIRGPLVRKLILEFFSTCRFADCVLDLDVVGTLQFQLRRLRCQMSWRQLILALGLHTAEEIDTDRELMRRLCHHLIAFTVAGRGQAPEKVTTTDLYYLRSMDKGMRLHRLEDEVCRLHESFGEKRLVVDAMSRYFLMFTTWVVGRLEQLLDASDVTYPRSENGISWFTDTAYQLPV